MTKAEAIAFMRKVWRESMKGSYAEEAYEMAIEALQRTSNTHSTHESVKPTHECVEPVGNSDQLNRTCANCKHYTEEHLCVFWSYFGFEPNDCCSRWEGRDD